MLRKYNDQKTAKVTVSDAAALREQRLIIFRILTVMLSVICLLLIVAIVIIAGYPKSQGYVIEIAADGSATMNPDAVTLLQDWTPAEETKRHFLGEFIRELRSVSSDPQIVQANIDRLYNRVTGNAADQVTDYIRETDPRNRLKNETVTIKIASILPLSDQTYQIDFRETVWTKSLRIKSDTHYRCIASFEIYTPRTNKQALYNPIGLYVTEFAIQQVQEI